MVREAMKMVSEQDEKDLNETAPSDEDIAEIFNFPEAKSTAIAIINEVDNDNMGIAGDTFPFKEYIKDAGFIFNRDKTTCGWRPWAPTSRRSRRCSTSTGSMWRSTTRQPRPRTRRTRSLLTLPIAV